MNLTSHLVTFFSQLIFGGAPDITAEVSSRQVKICIPLNHPLSKESSPAQLEAMRPTWAGAVKNTGVMRDENAGLVYTYALNTPLDQLIVRNMALNLARHSKTNATIHYDYDPNTETVFSFDGPIIDPSQSSQKQCRYTLIRAQEMKEKTVPLIQRTTHDKTKPQNTLLCPAPLNEQLPDELQSIVDKATTIPQHDQQIMCVIENLQQLLGKDFYNYKSNVWHRDLNDPLLLKQGDCKDYANMAKQMIDALGFKSQHAFIINSDTKNDVPMCDTEEFRKKHGNISQTPYHNILYIEHNNKKYWIDPMYSEDGARVSWNETSSVVLHVPYTNENTWAFKMTDQKFEQLPQCSQYLYTRYVILKNKYYFADPKGFHDHCVRPHGTFQISRVERPADPLTHIEGGLDYGIDQGKNFCIKFVPDACDGEPKHTIKTVIENAHIDDATYNINTINTSLYKVYDEGNNAVVELKNIFEKREEIKKEHELTVFFIRPKQQKKAPYLKKKQTLLKQKNAPYLKKKQTLLKQKKHPLF